MEAGRIILGFRKSLSQNFFSYYFDWNNTHKVYMLNHHKLNDKGTGDIIKHLWAIRALLLNIT